MVNYPSVDELLAKYSSKIEGQMGGGAAIADNYSRDYEKFKGEMAPTLSRYEKWAKSLGSAIKLKISEKDRQKYQKDLDIAHLNVEPWQCLTLSFMSFFVVFMVGLLGSIAYALIKGDIAQFPVLFFFMLLITSLFLFYFIGQIPSRLANKWRLKASSQMVPAILYIVVYMRHTANLEKAIAFASEHLQYPLALDFKKIFYNVEVGKFSTIKDSLDNYLEDWRGYATEFIEAFHLIESSLFEPDEGRRIGTLEKSLQVVLDGVYEKMLKFTHNVKSPLTNVYMLGVVLPTLGLALLPLASSMIGGLIKWYHVLILYNILIPFFVFFLTDKIMFLRPGGYGESTLLERNPLYPKYKSNKAFVKAFFLSFPFIFISLIPLIFQYTSIPAALGLSQDYTFAEIGLSLFGADKVFGFLTTDAGVVGPFGVGALILSLFLPLGIAIFFSVAYSEKTKELIKERENTKDLEREFNSSLFQLGNRLGNGVPPELVFGKVAEATSGMKTCDFFKRVNYNIAQMGMGVEKAIFDRNRGAISYYPSDLIATSMKVLVESSKKGVKIAAVSLMSISEYVKNMSKITERLKDLLAGIISDMKSNMTFLAPLLSGVVVGLSVMIVSILTKLKTTIGTETAGGGMMDMGTVLAMFEVENMIPPYFLQIAIGIYIVEIIFILTSTLVVVNSGQDKLEKTNKTGLNLKTGVFLYFVVALISTLALSLLTSIVLSGM